MTHDHGTTGRNEDTGGTADLPRFRSRLPTWVADELRAHPGRLAAIILTAFVAFGLSGVVAWSQRPAPVRAAPSATPTAPVPSTSYVPQPGPPIGTPSYAATPQPSATAEPSESPSPTVSPTGTERPESPRPEPSPKPTPKPTPSPSPTSTGDENVDDPENLQ